jgi:Ca-activated chloride channel family protein
MIFFIAFCLMVIPAAAQEPAKPAEPEQPLFRAGVALVKIDAQVVDRQGRAIGGLSRNDFQILDEGQPQEITYFGRESEPLDILLLLDVSGSMRRFLEEMGENARAALKQLHEGDRVGVMFFARRQEVAQPLTDALASAEGAIKDATGKQNLGGGTTINESLIAAARYLREQPPKGRRAVLIVTDNEGLNYQVPDEKVIRELYGANAVLNALVSGRGRRKDPLEGRETNPDFTPPDVFKLAEETGGEAVESRRAKEAFQTMIDRIRSRYSLQYPAPEAPAGGFRRVRVELAPEARRRHPDAVIKARAGYYALE